VLLYGRNVQGLLLVDHGSRRPESNQQLHEVAARVQRALGHMVLVRGAHMEIASPNIAEQVASLVAEGVTELTVVPYFLAPGRHAITDIPRLTQEAAAAFPDLSVRLAECLGVDDLLVQLVIRRAAQAGMTPSHPTPSIRNDVINPEGDSDR
jgi:sirohydrochlorin ferrochelatase